jgi:iron complex outermembrane receptor protein
MLFASIARGFKSGGFNGRASEASNPAQREPYDPEFVWTYEAGARTSWHGGRLLANLTGFYNDYTDLQLASFVGADSDGDGQADTFLPLFTNAGKAVTQGFELELSARPVAGLDLHAAAGYTDAGFEEYIERGIDVSGERELPQAPEWTASLGGAYQHRLGGTALELRIGGDVGYQGARQLTVSNLEDLRQDGYTVVNAYLGLASAGGRWRLTLGGRNLGDERYLISGLDGTPPPFGLVTGFYGDPRTWTLTLSTRGWWSG